MSYKGFQKANLCLSLVLKSSKSSGFSMFGMVNATKNLANLLKKGPKYSIERFLPIKMERNKVGRTKGMAINKPVKIRNNFFSKLYIFPPDVIPVSLSGNDIIGLVLFFINLILKTVIKPEKTA